MQSALLILLANPLPEGIPTILKTLLCLEVLAVMVMALLCSQSIRNRRHTIKSMVRYHFYLILVTFRF
jgi:hypothetical protein